MPWSDNSGKGGPTRGPWGQQPRPPGGGAPNGGGRGEPPDLEELLKASRQRLKRAFPRAVGGGNGGGGGRAPQLSRNTALIGGGVAIFLWWFSGWYQVEADELAVVTTFGRYEAVTGPGLHWHIPFPVQTARSERVTTVRPTIVPDTTRRGDVGGGLMLTADKNIVDIAIQVQWAIKRDQVPAEGQRLPPVAQYMFNIDDSDGVVRAVAEAAIREVVGRNPLEFVQETGRIQVQTQTRALMQEALDLYGSGVDVLAVNILKTEPPTAEVNAAFLDVLAANQNRENSINQARTYANRVVPEARGDGQRILEASRGYAAQVTADARGQAARFDAIFTEYQRAPRVTRQRMYLETLERVLGPMNKIIVEDDAAGGVVPYLPLNDLQRPRTNNQSGNQ